MSLQIDLTPKTWPLREPFAISRETTTATETLVVTIRDGAGAIGRGEGCGLSYRGETPAGMAAQIEAIRRALEAGLSRSELSCLLPPGGARCAVDCALWDLEAKQSGRSVFSSAGVDTPRAVSTAYTIGIRAAEDVRRAAEARASHAVLKIKVGPGDPTAAVAAARQGAPGASFIVDPNQAWSVDELKAYAPGLADLGVMLLEQPIAVGAEPGLDGYACPVALCADELIDDWRDLDRARGRFDVINIKLDKTGGLTEALRLANAARELGFELMVGCMAGSSLGMAPGMVLAQQCRFVDLDGPLLCADDWPGGLVYDDGVVSPPSPAFWG